MIAARDDDGLSLGAGDPWAGNKRAREEDPAVEYIRSHMQNFVDKWHGKAVGTWFDGRGGVVEASTKNASIKQVDPLLQAEYIEKCEQLLQKEDQNHDKDDDDYIDYREKRGIVRLWLYNKKDTWNYEEAQQHWNSKFYCQNCKSYPCDPIDDCSPRPEYDEKTDPYNEMFRMSKLYL